MGLDINNIHICYIYNIHSGIKRLNSWQMGSRKGEKIPGHQYTWRYVSAVSALEKLRQGG